MDVTPFAGVWIEKYLCKAMRIEIIVSLPSRCGVEILPLHYLLQRNSVTPFGGVWLKILNSHIRLWCSFVHSFTGVWIEMSCCCVPPPVRQESSLRVSVVENCGLGDNSKNQDGHSLSRSVVKNTNASGIGKFKHWSLLHGVCG